MRFKGIHWILLTFLLYPLGARAGDPLPVRLVRPMDAALRDRLATAHLVRGEPVDVNAITLIGENASAADHFNAGMALSLTGRYIKACAAFHRAISSSEPGSGTRLRALEQFLKISHYNPVLDLPALSDEELSNLPPELSLALSGYFADRGDREGALTILEGTVFKDTVKKAISGILTASHLAAMDRRDASARLIEGIKGNEPSALFDLLYLMRGYHYLQAGQSDRSRNAFLAITPSSPYFPEALLGKAWSLIRTGDLQGASIALEELVDRHRYSPAAGDGVLDLALTYRELGLYEKAGVFLSHHLERLREKRNWLLGLVEEDLGAGRDTIVLLEGVIDGKIPDRNLLLRAPNFVRQWIMEISADPVVRHATALLDGAGFVEKKVSQLRERLDKDGDLARREIDWVRHDISRASTKAARLEEMRNRLGSIREELNTTLQNRPLDEFASEKAMTLISKTGELKERLSLLENSVERAESFRSPADRLFGTVTASSSENQLNQIREKAYEGLLSSRPILGSLKNSLTALEGHIWLDVKGQAVELGKKVSFRVTSGRTRAGQALADTSIALGILSERQKALEALARTLIKSEKDLDTVIPERLAILRDRIEGVRADRILVLASKAAEEVKEAEARTLYTSADIEISRMEGTLRSLQEIVQ